MPHTKKGGERRHSWRLPILYNVLGHGRDENVDVLKGHLTEACMAAAGEQLDLVVIEDLEHFEELLEGGVPMARVADTPAPDSHVVTMSRWRYRALIVGALMCPSVWGLPHWALELERVLFGG